MAFTITEFLTFALSTVLWRLEYQIRTRLFNRLRKYPPFSSLSAKAIEDSHYLNAVTPSILQDSYIYLNTYEEIPDIQDEIASPQGRSEPDFARIANDSHIKCVFLLQTPFISEYKDLTLNVNKILRRRKTLGPDPTTCHIVIGELMSCLLDYTEKSAAKLAIINSTYTTLKAIARDYDAYVYNSKTTNSIFIRTYKDEGLTDALQDQDYLLADAGIDNEIIKFILCPSIGSFGISYFSDVKFPLYLSFFPLNKLVASDLSLWKARFADQLDSNSTDNDVLQLVSAIDDEHMQIYNAIALNSSLGLEVLKHRERLISQSIKDSSPDDGNDDGFGHFGMTGDGAPSRGSRNKPKRNQAPPPPPPPPPPPSVPTIPDDTNYEPDSLLASKASEYTALVRSKPATELYHDHMDRFSTTSEAPTNLGRSAVRTMESGEADFTIQTRIRGVKTNYVVTYTRKSRKPIFNIIA